MSQLVASMRPVDAIQLTIPNCRSSLAPVDLVRTFEMNSVARLMPIADAIVALIGSELLRSPEALAILAPGRAPLTFRALVRQIDAAILSLADGGFGRGDRVALALPNGPEMAVALLAVTGCATCVPLNPVLDEALYLVALRMLRFDVLVGREGEDTPAVRAAQSLM